MQRTEPGIPRPSTGKWVVFSIVAIGVFMGTVDSSIVNISLPTIAQGFGVPLSGAVEWVVIGYLVMNAAALLTAGRLSDMVGRKVVWSVGLFVFTASSVLCGLAFSLWFLILCRLIQGLGGALLFSTSPALLTDAFPPNERGRALGLNAVTVSFGTSVGPTLGGIITASLSWRWIFFVNLPLGVIGIILTARLLAADAPGRAVFDPWGAAALAIGLASLVAALSFGSELGLRSPLIITTGVVGIAGIVALPFIESRVPSPVLKFHLFRSRVFLSANLSLILSFLALFAVSFLMPFYLEQLRAFPIQVAGLLLTPLPLTIAVIAPISGLVADRTGTTRWLAAAGLLIACLGLALLGTLSEDTSMGGIVWRLVIVGLGQALFQAPNNSALMGSAPREDRGSAAGFLATGRVIGQSLSVALAGAVFASLGGAAAGMALASSAADPALQSTFVRSFRAALVACSAVALVGVFMSLVRGGAEGRKLDRTGVSR